MKPGNFYRCRKKPDKGNFTVGKIYRNIETMYTDDNGEKYRFVTDERQAHFWYLCCDEVMLTKDICPSFRREHTPLVEKVLKELNVK